MLQTAKAVAVSTYHVHVDRALEAVGGEDAEVAEGSDVCIGLEVLEVVVWINRHVRIGRWLCGAPLGREKVPGPTK
jgi:hypothetical protein